MMMDSNGMVLVVDDEPAIRLLLAMVLEDEGYDVEAAADGVDALDIAVQEQPVAVVLDLDMPRMDGRTCFRELRANGVTAPVVIVSGNDAHQVAREIGADASVQKPFDPLDIVAQLHALGA